MRTHALCSILLLCGSSSCSQEVPAAHDARAEAAETPGAPAARELAVKDLRFDLPEAWREATPSSSMRVAQYDVDDACTFVVFSFPGGGTVDANIDRWISQLSQPDGRDSRELAVRSRSERNGLVLHGFDLTGTWSGGMGDQGGEGMRFLATIVETPDGMVFLRLTGPADAVAAAKPDFDALSASARRAGGDAGR